MAIEPDFLSLLVCPQTRQPLRPAGAAELDAVNARIQAGGVTNAGGESVQEKLDEGLVPENEPVVYPVRDGIPILIPQEAIRLDAPASAGAAGPISGSPESPRS